MPLRVVYVDDEEGMCQAFVDNFSSSTIKIWSFSNITNIVQEIEKLEPDLVFLDYRMPGTTGDAIAKALNPELPKILISGDLFVNPVESYVRIFSKPFDFNEMEFFLNDCAEKKK